MQLTIREEQPPDRFPIRQVNEAAFERAAEADLVDVLRAHDAVQLSLVAETAKRVVGHVLISPVRLITEAGELEGSGLGPMAVLPEYQRVGVGSQLVNEAIGRLRVRGVPFLVVLGHPRYYPRFGFVPASRQGLRCSWEVPDEAFMLLPLDPSRLAGVTGVVRYREEFDAVT
ncbi:MAG TPA: N-acetyltransferase [Planctomycetota bacterium]|nr:N-acetyltransferase [Planctomycetota bacterium]